MKNPNEDKRTGIMFMWLGVIPVVWAALMVAPFLSEGLAGIVEGFTSGMRNPVKVTWCADSLKAICIFLVIYGMSLGVYYSTHRNYRKGEEHGSAKWGDPRQICRKYAEKDKSRNVILTQNVRIGLDGRKHRRNLNVLVVGGSGIHSFDETHPSQMPTALEAGTLNVPGLAGLGAGVEWILSQGVEALHEKEMALTRLFYEKIVHAPDVKIYGSFDETDRAPIVSLNFGDEDAARAADILWEDYGICVRAGAHCAPLIHKALGTVEQGMVRFSFSHQNTEAEVLKAAEAVCELAEEG